MRRERKIAFDQTRLATAFAIVQTGMEKGFYPGAVAAVGGAKDQAVIRTFGWACVEPEARPMTADALFDLASLTKVVATTPAILHLLETGAFLLETPVQQIIPEFNHPDITVRHLLTHTSGLPAWRGLYLDHRGWEEYVDAIGSLELCREPGTTVGYSDLGFILLGAIIMRVTKKGLPDFCREAVFEPLGMTETGWLPSGSAERIVATERGNQVEYAMCGDRAPGFGRWRLSVARGEVNDGNAFYGLDGIASHAGLFAPVQDLIRYARAWLRGGMPMLGRHTGALATRSHTLGLNDNRALGWTKPPAQALNKARASCGDLLSATAFGHTGFTGTSLWIDPQQDLFVILLTNRLHPVAQDGLMSVRPAFHDAVVSAMV
jgi:CubicO group peptidase (beta-lactamase class C family)